MIHPGIARAAGAFAIATAAVLAACGCSPAATGTDPGTATTRIGFSAVSIDTDFLSALADQVQSAGEAAGADVTVSTADHDPAKQANDVNTLVSSGAQGVIIDSVNADAIGPAIDRAAAAGAKVVVVDSAAAANENIAIQVLTDNYAAGEAACRLIGDQLGGQGTTLNLQGALDNQVARDRSSGYTDCMAEAYPDMTVISQPFNWDSAQCAQIVSTQFSTTRIDGVFAAAGYCLGPVRTALESQDRLIPAGEPGHMPFAVIDGTPEELDAVRDGWLTASIVQPLGTIADAAVEWLNIAMDDGQIEEGPTDRGTEVVDVDGTLRELIPPVVVTRDDVEDPTLWANQ